MIRIFFLIGILLPAVQLLQLPAESMLGRAPQDQRRPINPKRYECLDQCLIAPETSCPQIIVCHHVVGAAHICKEVLKEASFRCVEMEEGTLKNCDNVPENEWCFHVYKNPCDVDAKPSCFTELDGCGSKFRCDV